MKRLDWLRRLSCIVLAGVVFACQDEEPQTAPDKPVQYEFTFEQGTENWQAGFADYRQVQEADYELETGHATLPPSVNRSSKALKISGRNLSDDLFMFWKREVTGLLPKQTYHVVFEIDLASQYPSNSFGVGGSPGSSVYLKVGATAEEPQTILDDQGYLRMNIDKSNQSQSGEDMKVIGDIGIPGDEFTYTLIQRSNTDNPFLATSDENGRLWLIFGTESGFEATTTLYYDQVRVKLTPVVKE